MIDDLVIHCSRLKTTSHHPRPTKVDGESIDLEDEAHGTVVGTKLSTKQKILRVIWDTFDKSPEERRFVTKVDLWIMTYVCLAYFVKYLDQTNVVNAYVTGMKEDLNMKGNEYNMLLTMFTIGYTLGNLPSQLMMTKIRPSIWLPTLELIWGSLVMCMAAAKNIETLYTLRFLIGFLEASAYPGFLSLLGNWYTPQELGKRSCIFICSAYIAQMFSGYLQAGLYVGMDGKHGLKAWQWLFIFDGIIGIPVCILGYFAIPDSPTNSKALWLKPEEKAIGISRMERVGRKAPAKLTWKTIKNVFSSWPVYLFSVPFALQLLAIRIYNYFNIYLKDTGRYTVEQVNVIPTAGYAFQVVTTLIMAWVSDGIGRRAPSIFFGIAIGITGTIILCFYPENNHSLMLAAWILTFGQSGASALILTWINEILTFSTEQRLVVFGVVETFGFAMNAWVILYTYPSGEAPRFKIGYQMATMFFAVEAIFIAAIVFCEKKWKPKGHPDQVSASE
ncbi:unnamed protein product [Clonostachys chloroleuca]|uniref:Major facilitator superfamily (MFS) profile domain-containing protein n=1 Tax=Clonostachys chloroleuca TaxID=1926264 RepID=A0AA35Q1H5_9HYPO|nr:unnamed protein product [Clonostachys chloroleuca]